MQAGIANVQSNFNKTIIAAACYWPVINFIAYHYLPFHLRYACFDFFSFIYAVGLSLMNNNNKEEKALEDRITNSFENLS
jgi:hypothetical protein